MLRVRNAKSGVVCLIELSCSCGVKTSYRNCCVINVMTCLMCLAFLPCFPECETRHWLVVSGQWCVVNAMCGWCCVANAVFKPWVVLHRVIYGSSVACETSLCVSVYVVLWKPLRKVFWVFWPGVESFWADQEWVVGTRRLQFYRCAMHALHALTYSLAWTIG